MNIKIINPLTYQGWDDLLLSNPGYSFFHSSDWARVLHESYQYKPVYFTLIKEDKLLALIPFMEVKSIIKAIKGVSLPFTDYVDPVFSDDNLNHEIFDILVRYGKKAGWKSIEIRGGGENFQGLSPSSIFYGHTLDLSGNKDDVFNNFRDNNKRNINKSIRNGIKIDLYNTLESVKQFYRLNCMTRKVHGLPPQPGFFLKRYMTILFLKILALLYLLLIKKELSRELSVFTLERRHYINMALRI